MAQSFITKGIRSITLDVLNKDFASKKQSLPTDKPFTIEWANGAPALFAQEWENGEHTGEMPVFKVNGLGSVEYVSLNTFFSKSAINLKDGNEIEVKGICDEGQTYADLYEKIKGLGVDHKFQVIGKKFYTRYNDNGRLVPTFIKTIVAL